MVYLIIICCAASLGISLASGNIPGIGGWTVALLFSIKLYAEERLK